MEGSLVGEISFTGDFIFHCKNLRPIVLRKLLFYYNIMAIIIVAMHVIFGDIYGSAFHFVFQDMIGRLTG